MYSIKINALISNDNHLSGVQFANRKQNNKHKTKELGLVGIQTKLGVGSVDDPAEKEADPMADQAMRMPDSQLKAMPAVKSMHAGQELVSQSCVAGKNSVAEHGVLDPIFQCKERRHPRFILKGD